MNDVHPLFAALGWPFSVMLMVTALVVLFCLSLFFARTSLQLLANILLSSLCSVVLLSLSERFLFNASRLPPLREYEYLPIVFSTALAVGAVIGVALSVLLRKGFVWFIHRQTGRAVKLLYQDSSFHSRYPRVSSTGARQSDPISTDPLYGRFTDRARKVMQLANQEAQRLNHEYIGTEHILLGLIKEGRGVAANVLKNLDVDLRMIRLEVEKLVQSGRVIVTLGKLLQTPRAKMVIGYSMEEARNLNHNYVGTEHILLGLLREQEGMGAQVLMNFGLRMDTVRTEILALLGHSHLPSDLQTQPASDKPPVGQMSELKRKAVQCTFDECSAKATFHLTYAERRKCVREAHLCERHARKVLDPYLPRPEGCPGTPSVLQDAIHFDIDLVIITDIYDEQVIYLCEVGGKRWVPMLTGIFEATALDRKLKGFQSPRPLTHDAMATIIRAFGAIVQDVIIDDLKEHTYYSKVRIRHGNELLSLDLRPSDAFMLAVIFDCPIFFLNKVLDKLS